MNGLCPACRRPYSEDQVEFTPLSKDEIAKLKAEQKQKEREKKEQAENAKKQLAALRVVQKNLVYIVGLQNKYANDEWIRAPEQFGQFGAIKKVVLGKKQSASSYGIYITYFKKEDAARAVAAVDGTVLDGKVIRATFGTTKYCTHYLKNQPCPNQQCMYLHEPGEAADKEDDDYVANPPPKQVLPFPFLKQEDKIAAPIVASWAKPNSTPSSASGSRPGTAQGQRPPSITPEEYPPMSMPSVVVPKKKKKDELEETVVLDPVSEPEPLLPLDLSASLFQISNTALHAEPIKQVQAPPAPLQRPTTPSYLGSFNPFGEGDPLTAFSIKAPAVSNGLNTLLMPVRTTTPPGISPISKPETPPPIQSPTSFSFDPFADQDLLQKAKGSRFSKFFIQDSVKGQAAVADRSKFEFPMHGTAKEQQHYAQRMATAQQRYFQMMNGNQGLGITASPPKATLGFSSNQNLPTTAEDFLGMFLRNARAAAPADISASSTNMPFQDPAIVRMTQDDAPAGPPPGLKDNSATPERRSRLKFFDKLSQPFRVSPTMEATSSGVNVSPMDFRGAQSDSAPIASDLGDRSPSPPPPILVQMGVRDSVLEKVVPIGPLPQKIEPMQNIVPNQKIVSVQKVQAITKLESVLPLPKVEPVQKIEPLPKVEPIQKEEQILKVEPIQKEAQKLKDEKTRQIPFKEMAAIDSKSKAPKEKPVENLEKEIKKEESRKEENEAVKEAERPKPVKKIILEKPKVEKPMPEAEAIVGRMRKTKTEKQLEQQLIKEKEREEKEKLRRQKEERERELRRLAKEEEERVQVERLEVERDRLQKEKERLVKETQDLKLKEQEANKIDKAKRLEAPPESVAAAAAFGAALGATARAVGAAKQADEPMSNNVLVSQLTNLANTLKNSLGGVVHPSQVQQLIQSLTAAAGTVDDYKETPMTFSSLGVDAGTFVDAALDALTVECNTLTPNVPRYESISTDNDGIWKQFWSPVLDVLKEIEWQPRSDTAMGDLMEDVARLGQVFATSIAKLDKGVVDFFQTIGNLSGEELPISTEYIDFSEVMPWSQDAIMSICDSMLSDPTLDLEKLRTSMKNPPPASLIYKRLLVYYAIEQALLSSELVHQSEETITMLEDWDLLDTEFGTGELDVMDLLTSHETDSDDWLSQGPLGQYSWILSKGESEALMMEWTRSLHDGLSARELLDKIF